MPALDLALVALFLVSGIREGEAVALGMASVTGPAAARRLEVVGKGGKTRTIPTDPSLEGVLAAYLTQDDVRVRGSPGGRRPARRGSNRLDRPVGPRVSPLSAPLCPYKHPGRGRHAGDQAGPVKGGAGNLGG